MPFPLLFSRRIRKCGINLKKYLKRQPSSRPLIVMRIGAVSILMLPRSQICPVLHFSYCFVRKKLFILGFFSKILTGHVCGADVFITKCPAYEFKHNDFD